MSSGYGIIPKEVMQNNSISLQAKAVYAYFASFAGKDGVCFPSYSKMEFDLNCTSGTLRKYINELVKCGYIVVEQVKEKGKFSHNIYRLPCYKKPCTEKTDTVKTAHGKLSTTNNKNTNTNNYKNTKYISKAKQTEIDREKYTAFGDNKYNSQENELNSRGIMKGEQNEK